MDDEVALEGGYVHDVVRVGGTVRRRVLEPQPYVHAVLTHLESAGWEGSPRFLGFDEEGREVLSWIDGHVPWSGVDEPPGIYDTGSAAGVARLLRQLHDLTASTGLAAGSEVVCHNDLSPRNTVYRTSAPGAVYRPVAFLDWDLAAPGRRIEDVALACWQWATSTSSDVVEAARVVRAIADEYGLIAKERASLIDTILWWQDRCWRGIQEKIDRGEPEVQRLREVGAVASVRADWAWTTRHRVTLERALG